MLYSFVIYLAFINPQGRPEVIQESRKVIQRYMTEEDCSIQLEGFEDVGRFELGKGLGIEPGLVYSYCEPEGDLT